MSGDIAGLLATIVGPSQIMTGAAIAERHLADASGWPAGQPLAVIRPADTAQVAAVLALCNARKIAVVPLGGQTGMAGGAVPGNGEVALSLERLRAVEEIDRDAGTITVQAGLPLAAAQEAAGRAGLAIPVDIGARGSCTIGGMIATNAGGNQVLRYGMMRENVLGLEAVLADGTVMTSLNKMLKNNAGYDLKQLFIGSEGTLGVVTRAVIRLRPRLARPVAALCAVPDYAAAVNLLRRLDEMLPNRLTAFEAMWRDFLVAAIGVLGVEPPLPLDHPLYVLIEIDGGESADPLVEALAGLAEAGLLTDAVVARSGRERDRFWAMRDAIGELTRRMTVVEPFDVSLPIAAIGAFVEAVVPALTRRWPACTPLCFGHIADSNLHLALSMATREDGARAADLVYAMVRDHGGSISAEHGIGRLKRDHLGHSRSDIEIALMRRLKALLDPEGILNPGRIL